MHEGDESPDGWVLIHADFVFGPLPQREWLESLLSTLTCSCPKTIYPVFFPHGVTMKMVSDVWGEPLTEEPPPHLDPLGALKRIH